MGGKDCEGIKKYTACRLEMDRIYHQIRKTGLSMPGTYFIYASRFHLTLIRRFGVFFYSTTTTGKGQSDQYIFFQTSQSFQSTVNSLNMQTKFKFLLFSESIFKTQGQKWENRATQFNCSSLIGNIRYMFSIYHHSIHSLLFIELDLYIYAKNITM